MWLNSKAPCLADIVELCPQMVIDRFVFITSIDSGLVQLDEDRLKAGWKPMGKRRKNFDWSHDECENPLALSPRVSNPVILPTGTYDEWYLFTKEPQIDTVEVFANGNFSPTFGYAEMKENHAHVELEQHFWNQIAELDPLAYIADNQSFSFVTQDTSLYEQVLLAVQKVELEIGTACDARSTLADS